MLVYRIPPERQGRPPGVAGEQPRDDQQTAR
jgi:hypothetical protein